MKYTIATFNMKRETRNHSKHSFELRLGSLNEFFRSVLPDIVGTQELTADALSYFSTVRDMYDWVGEPRTTDKKGEYTSIFYRHDVFDLLEHDTFWLSQHPQTVGSRAWFTMFPRTCTWCILQDKNTGSKLRIYNTHLDCLSPLARIKGLKLIKSLADSHETDDLAGTVIMGDFNASPSSKTVRFLLEHTGDGRYIRDSYNALIKSDPDNLRTYHGFHGKTKGQPIDYIFTSKNLSIDSAYIDRTEYASKYPSDHYPVVAQITSHTQGTKEHEL